MPSKRKQFNVRPDEATWEAIDRAKAMAERKIGIALSYSDFLKLAVAALEEKHRDKKPKREGGAS